MSWRKKHKQTNKQKKTYIKVIKLEKPEDLLRPRVTVISNVIEFGWNIDIFLNCTYFNSRRSKNASSVVILATLQT